MKIANDPPPRGLLKPVILIASLVLACAALLAITGSWWEQLF
jgi:hypothetical protein